MSVSMYIIVIICKDVVNVLIVVNVNGLYILFYYDWYKNGILLNDIGLVIIGFGLGIYSFVVIDFWGNSKSDIVLFLNSDEVCFIIVYNGFIFNGDGINDGFVIDYIDMF